MIGHLYRCCRGSVAVEFAILAPVMVLLFVGGAEVGLAEIQALRLTFIAEVAARCSGVKNSLCTSGSATEAWAAAQMPGITAENFKVTPTDDSTCNGTVVTASLVYRSMVLPTFTINAWSCYPSAPASSPSS
jgi:Flp pilus assembly protein TadG